MRKMRCGLLKRFRELPRGVKVVKTAKRGMLNEGN
jgi:hypothetical protein